MTPPASQPSTDTTPSVAPLAVATPAAPLATTPADAAAETGTSISSQAIGAMLAKLSPYVPEQESPLPKPGVSVASLVERAVGLGNHRREERRSRFTVVELKGLRLDAAIRFQLWATGPAQAEQAATDLNTKLMADHTTLRDTGFLRLALEGAPPPEPIPNTNAWRKTADYRVLFEYRYEARDAADSLIARIPIDLIGEFTESTLVTDEITRWDNVEAPALELSGQGRSPVRIGSIIILSFLPTEWDGSSVTISLSAGGTLRQKSFASVRDFQNALAISPEPEPISLGGNSYRVGQMAFPNVDFPAPIALASGTDVFRVEYGSPAFDSPAVVYVRALR